MAIRKTYGAGAVAGLGFQTGKAEAEQRSAQLAFEASERRAAQESDQQYREAIREQDLAIDLQMQERSKLWEIEKMEMRSRMDFEREERTRQKKLAEKEAKVNALENAFKNGQIGEEDYQQAVLQTQSEIPFYTQHQINQRAGGESTPSPSRQLGDINAAFELQGYTSEDLKEVGLDPDDFPMIPQAGGTTGDAIGTVTPTTPVTPTGGGKMIIVQDKEGNIVQIPNDPAIIQQAIELGATILSSTVDKSRSKNSPAGQEFLEEGEVQKKRGRFDYLRDRFPKF